MTRIYETRDQGEMVEIECLNCDNSMRTSLGPLDDPIRIYKDLREVMEREGWSFHYTHDGEIALCPKCEAEWRSREAKYMSDASSISFEGDE